LHLINKCSFARNGTFTQPALQGSVVVANPESGELLAVVGGYGTFTGFNRALDASRQVGSLLNLRCI
jgi:penicillin-binding protein 1B